MASYQKSRGAASADLGRTLGARLAKLRLSRNMTQKQLAAEAGIGQRTLVRFEAGEGASLDTFLRLLIALGIEDNLDVLIPNPAVRPVERVALSGRERRRARPDAARGAPGRWRWGDEEPDID